ncbi:uncharacterized protein STEHIDRAFT_66042 [Stereum hirsutum FP-91666 SS1]|uniref:uncharacterized protein n=1 Tax=Stereum hirsutum (strain FP-91666) TaxID=721885 RepID=UPI00044494D9|nr:uncharacterized protein STEHIDRAFT_66042 [Stereum hirsutum FP-91666 SS1]EIM81705.1 hypothetical protein STEHIDRAFT_66042 [Stereum hirsutum FP-91666 SS1]
MSNPSTDPSTGNSNVSGASQQSVTSGDELVTFRFEHNVDGDGHHVLTGREGKLARCEDEPIRTPGAVQSFGVLIVIQENPEEETLTVRQVSENAAELLGLTPRYLFSLPCFSEILPDSQVDVLWDNIQFLPDPDLHSTDEDDSPHVFLINGWGEPGSAHPDDPDADQFRRRYWSCWCAAHRPKQRASGSSSETGAGAGGPSTSRVVDNGGLIILEFELERDTFNPLYPMPSPTGENNSTTTGMSSPGSAGSGSSGGTGGSTSSGTLVSGSTTTVQNGEEVRGLDGQDDWRPSAAEILESTTNHAKPLPALERIRKMSRMSSSASASGAYSSPTPGIMGPVGLGGGGPLLRTTRRGTRRSAQGSGVGMMDVFAVMAQINEQLGAANDLDGFLKIVVGVIKDLTQFHRVLVYQFDENWNGQTVAELVDWNRTHDLYKGLHFPASDIPAQARELYCINKMRLLYDREQVTARLVVKSREDLETPLNMTHCYLRAMSPIHLKYLGNMGVRSSMSVSIMAFGTLWGLVACHSYGNHGIRVSFPVRQMLRLLSDSISRNIERLSYAQRLHTRKLFNTLTSDQHPTGYIVSNADDLLGLFDADFGVLVIGEGAKILGPNQHGQEVLLMAEYLRVKQFTMIQVSQAVTKDFPDLQLSAGLEVIAGLLHVPLSPGGNDFIAFLRKGQPRHVHWAGKPFKEGAGPDSVSLEPRKSFKVWSEKVAGRCRNWTDEQLETAGVLALVYGKFIEVWRQKETALQTTKLTNILLSNAGHEVRTPLNHIINCLELALSGSLDSETRENLSQSHAASKSLLFTINDLLDLTRLESGHEMLFSEPFDLPFIIEEATNLYKSEAVRRGLEFRIDCENSPRMVIGDSSKIRTVVANLTANALKYTEKGGITITCRAFEEPIGLRNADSIAVEIVVQDTGCGIAANKLESIFREFEQVDSALPKTGNTPGLGLGLAVVARVVEQLGGQLRVDSKVDEGSRFSFLLPFPLSTNPGERSFSAPSPLSGVSRERASSRGSGSSREVDSLVDALASSLGGGGPGTNRLGTSSSSSEMPPSVPGTFAVRDSGMPVRPVKVDEFEMEEKMMKRESVPRSSMYVKEPSSLPLPKTTKQVDGVSKATAVGESSRSGSLRVLIVEDNDINRMILAKRLTLDGHIVVNTKNGQEGVDMVKSDQNFDIILMDVQMPILNGFQATEAIRLLEMSLDLDKERVSHALNGRIPIFAVSASLLERQRVELAKIGVDGWILKPIDFKRLSMILRGVTNTEQRERDEYQMGRWEIGGWLPRHPPSATPSEVDVGSVKDVSLDGT